MKYWKLICHIDDIPLLGSRLIKSKGPDIALFRNAENEVFAMHDKCPHKGGPLSEGIVHGRRVTCPLHGMNIRLDDGQAVAPDTGHTPCIEIKLAEEHVYLKL